MPTRRCNDQPVLPRHCDLAPSLNDRHAGFHHRDGVTGNRLHDLPSLIQDRVQCQIHADQVADLLDVLSRGIGRVRADLGVGMGHQRVVGVDRG